MFHSVLRASSGALVRRSAFGTMRASVLNFRQSLSELFYVRSGHEIRRRDTRGGGYLAKQTIRRPPVHFRSRPQVLYFRGLDLFVSIGPPRRSGPMLIFALNPGDGVCASYRP